MIPLCFIFGLSKTSKKNKLIQINMNDQHRCLLHILFYYTLRFYFPSLSLLAQPVTIFVYGPVVYGPARYLHYLR